MSNLESPPRVAELWPKIRDRIATTRMATILGGTGRVWVEGDYTDPPWAEDQPGGRVVVVPTLPLPAQWLTGQPTPRGFLIRVDFNQYEAPGYSPIYGLEAASREAFDRLQFWVPTNGTKVMAARPIQLIRPWQPRPLTDLEAQGVVYVSSEYRVETADPPS